LDSFVLYLGCAVDRECQRRNRVHFPPTQETEKVVKLRYDYCVERFRVFRFYSQSWWSLQCIADGVSELAQQLRPGKQTAALFNDILKNDAVAIRKLQALMRQVAIVIDARYCDRLHQLQNELENKQRLRLLQQQELQMVFNASDESLVPSESHFVERVSEPAN